MATQNPTFDGELSTGATEPLLVFALEEYPETRDEARTFGSNSCGGSHCSGGSSN